MSHWDRGDDYEALKRAAFKERVRQNAADPTHPCNAGNNPKELGASQDDATAHAQPSTETLVAQSCPGHTPVGGVAVASPRMQLLQMAVPTVWELLHEVGTIRTFSITAGGPKGYKITLKLKDHGGRHVYRYGFISSPSEAEAVISLWVKEGYWTPDRY